MKASSLCFWMDYRDAYVPGCDADDRANYPCLGWACDHFHGQRRSPVSDRDYPLTWEAEASQAHYEGMAPVAGMEDAAAEWRPFHLAKVLAEKRDVGLVPAELDQFLRLGLGRSEVCSHQAAHEHRERREVTSNHAVNFNRNRSSA